MVTTPISLCRAIDRANYQPRNSILKSDIFKRRIYIQYREYRMSRWKTINRNLCKIIFYNLCAENEGTERERKTEEYE